MRHASGADQVRARTSADDEEPISLDWTKDFTAETRRHRERRLEMTWLLASVSSLLMGFRKRVCSAVRPSCSASPRLRGEFFVRSRLAALLAVAACGIRSATRTAGTAESAARGSITDTAQADQFAESRQRLNGNVGTVDSSNGTVTVGTAAGELTLHFPPESLGGMRSGEPLIVEYPRSPRERPRPGPTTRRPAPEPSACLPPWLRRITAPGGVRVRWDTAMLNLVFPPPAIQNLNPGDRVTADLAFSRMISPRTIAVTAIRHTFSLATRLRAAFHATRYRWPPPRTRRPWRLDARLRSRPS